MSFAEEMFFLLGVVEEELEGAGSLEWEEEEEVGRRGFLRGDEGEEEVEVEGAGGVGDSRSLEKGESFLRVERCWRMGEAMSEVGGGSLARSCWIVCVFSLPR